jgi:hypothetical protein
VICPSNNQTIKRRSQKAMKKRADAYKPVRVAGLRRPQPYPAAFRWRPDYAPLSRRASEGKAANGHNPPKALCCRPLAGYRLASNRNFGFG